MKTKSRKQLAFVAASACALTLMSQRVSAVPSLTLFDGVTTITVVDNDSNDSSPLLGSVTFNGVIGIWDINVSTGLTKPLLGSSTLPRLDLNSINHSSGAGTLVLTFTETGFNTANMPYFAEIGGTQNGGNATIKSVTLQGTNQVSSIGALSGTPFTGSANGVFLASTNYSLSDVMTVVHTAAGVTSFNKAVNPINVPDGGLTAMMLGLGFLGVEGVRRKILAA